MDKQYTKRLSLCVMIGDAAYAIDEPEVVAMFTPTNPLATPKSEAGIDSEIGEIVR